ncbi:MAG TPA: LCP family protein [Mycobacteriales bacterium]|jgi:LCP family protein required for cell wall assembly|nr:LCP family protein [Mycobacteriales bacterium]
MRSWTRRRLLGTVALAMAIVLVAVVGIAWVAISSIFNNITTKNCASCISANGGKGLNVLIIGSDSRAGLTKAQKKSLHVGSDPGQRSDTMILLHIPANGGKADMVSLPRDSYVTIPAHCPSGDPPTHGKCANGQAVVSAAKNKLNAAYSFGGATLTVSTVIANTHVPVNDYVEINFEGFVTMVDKLGGVPICNAKAIHDPVVRNSAGQYSGSGLELPAGHTTLNGAQALEYVRAREFDPSQGDLGRIQRQQKFMAAMLNKAESAGVLLNLPKLYGFLKSVTGSLTVNKGLGKSEMLSLARKLHSMSPKNVNLLTVPLSNTALSTPVGSSVLWDPVLSKRLFHDFAADKPITNVTKPSHLTVAPSNISLTVLNASSINGLAAKAGQALAGVGFSIANTTDAPNSANPNQTVVLYGASRGQSANTVVAAVPGSIKRKDSALGNGIELLVGSNYSTVKAVHVSNSTERPTVTTGASNPCSSN